MEKKPFSTRNLAGGPPPGDGSGDTVCPYCDHRFGAGGLGGYVYCPACGKRFNPGSLLAETVVLSPEMTTKVLIASPADADTAELPAVPVVDEESEAKRFGDYDILSEVARGGMGVVYRARHRLLKRVVALKVLRAGEGASQDDINRFMQEAKAVASLSHPNIVPIHELSVEKGQYYFTMNFIEGWSLDQIIERQKLSPYRACEIIETIARAIHYAHTKGIVHRDIKPANVIMSEDNRPMITDFGLAVNLSANRDERRMTRDGSVMGTIPYIPPEQAAGRLEDIGPRSDVYSLGAMFYEMLTGRPPFTGMTQYELLQRVINQYPPSPRKLNPRINADLDTICMKCLAKEPERRYQTALALATDCRAFLNGDVIKARPTTLLYRAGRLAHRYPVQTALAALVLLLGLAVLAIANFAKETREELETKKDEHQQAMEEKKKLDERVERPWREDFSLRWEPRPNLTNDVLAARNQQLCWMNREATAVRGGKLWVRPAGNGRQAAFGIPVNLPARYRLSGTFSILDEGHGDAQLEILFGVDGRFFPDSRATMALALGARGNPGARLTLNGTVLAENNAFFLEDGREYAFEIVQSGPADAGLADGESYQAKNFSLRVDDKEIFATTVPPASELRPESYFALAARGMTVALSRFDVIIPGLNQEMVKSLLEVGNSLSNEPDERSLARLLYRRVLRERVPVSVILQVYLGFAKTTIDRDRRPHRREDPRKAFERLTANLNQSRGELVYQGELEYGYGLTLAIGNRPQEAERYFVEACRKARDAARQPLDPRLSVWVGAFRPYDYSPLVAPFDRDERFATISGTARWQALPLPDARGNYSLPGGTVASGAKCYAMFVFDAPGETAGEGGKPNAQSGKPDAKGEKHDAKGDQAEAKGQKSAPGGKAVDVSYPADCRLWINGELMLNPEIKDDMLTAVSHGRFRPGANQALLELPATQGAQKFVFVAEENAWDDVNVFGLLARLDEALSILARGDAATAVKRLEKMREDGVIDLLRTRYANELQARAAFADLWRRVDDLLRQAGGATHSELLASDNRLAQVVRILDIAAALAPQDGVRGKELARRYCTAADVYVNKAGEEKREAEKCDLLYQAEQLLGKAAAKAGDWYFPAFKQATLLYGRRAAREQADLLFRDTLARFPDSVELRLDVGGFYLRPDLVDYLTGEPIPRAPDKARPVAEEALRLSDRHNPQAFWLLAEALLALGDPGAAWGANAEGLSLERLTALVEQQERIRARLNAPEPVRAPPLTPHY